MRKLILISLKNSLKLVTIYPIHTVMTFIYALLSIVLNLLFWLVLTTNFGEIGLYGIKEIMVLNMFALLADSLGGFFFGYRDLPYCINDGSYDKYLILPRRDIFLFLISFFRVLCLRCVRVLQSPFWVASLRAIWRIPGH